MSRMANILPLFALMLIIASCTTKVPPTAEEEKALFEKTLQEKLNKVKANKIKDCYLTAVQEAEAFVDSTLHLELDLDLLDTIEMIERPFRPERPDFIRNLDTSRVKPLFEHRDSLFLSDTLISQ